MGLKEFWQWFSSGKKAFSSSPAPLPVSQTGQTAAARPAPQTVSPHPTQPIPTVQPVNLSEGTGKRKLGQWMVLFILVNSILGTSLFYLPSLGVRSMGASSIIAWIVLFVLATFVMLYVAELITMHPTSGGTYEFCKLAYGRFGSFVAGWMIWLAGNLGMALSVVAAAQYFIPETTQSAFYLQMMFVALWIIVLNFLAFWGIDAGSTMLVVFGIIAVVVVLGMTLPSFIDVPALFSGEFRMPFDSSFFTPFFQDQGYGLLPSFGLALLLISEAFLGFEAVSYMANEVKEPKKLHRVLLFGIVLTGVIMTLYVLSSLGTVPYDKYITDSRPFAAQALQTLGEKGQTFIVFGMYLVIVGAAAAWPITGSRLIQAMAQDKLFPTQLAVLHPKYKSPYRAVLFQTVAVFVFSWLIFRGYEVGWNDPYKTMYLIYVMLSLLVVSLVILTVPVLRKKEATLERVFRAPLPFVGPIVFVVLLIGLIVNWAMLEGSVATGTLRIAFSIAFLGMPLYFLVEMLYNPKSFSSTHERFDKIAVWTERIFFPFSIRKALVKDLGNMQGKVLLEYGCSSGLMTKILGEQMVTSTGRVYATDTSLHKVKIAMERTKHMPHVSVHHHPHLDDFKLLLPEKVDGVVSVGVLSSLQNPLRALTSLGMQVKKGGEVVFVDYDTFFYFIPNVQWVRNDDALKQLFHNAGFEVNVQRKQGVLWKYVMIAGVKK